MNTSSSLPRIVSPSEWLDARRQLLAREKELTRLQDAVAAERRQLPRVKIEKNYRFEGEHGPATLAELFGPHHQLIVYHFMLGPGWQEGCRSCSFAMDHTDGALPHLHARDTAFAAISRAPYAEIAPFRRRMGWAFNWVSSHGSDFNRDFNVSFSREDMEAGRVTYNFQTFPAGPLPVEELPGISVFARDDAGNVFHTYSAYSRGCEPAIGTYRWLDLTPKGRDEDAYAFSMAWVRYHDRYHENEPVDTTVGYTPPRGSFCRACD